MHPACPNKKQNHLQNSLLRWTQFWVRKTFSKLASLKRASLVVLSNLSKEVVVQHQSFHTCFLDSAINSDSATICHRTVVRKEFSLFVSSRGVQTGPTTDKASNIPKDLLAGWLILFFPSNAFIASARSLHTLNRSKKMNCNYHARLSTCR